MPRSWFPCFPGSVSRAWLYLIATRTFGFVSQSALGGVSGLESLLGGFGGCAVVVLHRLGNGSHIGTARPFEAKRERGQLVESVESETAALEREEEEEKEKRKDEVEDKREVLASILPAANLDFLPRLPLLLYLAFTALFYTMPAPAPTAVSRADDRQAKKRLAEAQKSYGRGKAIQTKSVKDKKLRSNLKAVEAKNKDASLKAKESEILLEHDPGFIEPEGELERTYKVRQDEIQENIGVETAKKGFELRLDGMGPYRADYTRNGRNLLLAGRKGHVATMDWRDGKLGCELQLGETVRDARWLHNNQFFAVAQKKYVYIYDHSGAELHCLSRHVEPMFLEFLPYHFLLASAVRISPRICEIGADIPSI